MSGHTYSFVQPLTASSLPSLVYNVTGTSALQDSAQQWGAVNSIYMNAQALWDQDRVSIDTWMTKITSPLHYCSTLPIPLNEFFYCTWS